MMSITKNGIAACDRLTAQIVDAAIQVHRRLGPGLLESTYRACLVSELESRDIRLACEVPIPIRYRDREIDVSYRADVIVEGCVLLELKCVEQLLPLHQAQLLTYLKLTNLRIGFLINFNTTRLMTGLRRFVL